MRLADGVATVTCACAEVGQGFVTLAQQITREALGVDEVVLAPADTSIGTAGSTSASRQTWVSGGAVLAACEAVRAAVLARAAELGRRARPRPPPGQVFEETVEYHHAPTFPLDEDGQGDAHLALTIAAHRAVVDVDPELGLVRLVDLTTSQEVGRILNPTQLLGQLEGGAAQGVGLALMEEIVVVDGLVRNPSFTDYLIPTALDLPDLRDRRHHRGGRARRAVRGQGRRRGADHLVGPGRGRRHPRRHRPRPHPGAGPARRHRPGRPTMSAADHHVAADRPLPPARPASTSWPRSARCRSRATRAGRAAWRSPTPTAPGATW